MSVLFYCKNIKSFNFQDLEAEVIPVFPLEQSITIKGYSVQRKQVPIYPVFGLTDYKVQGLILTTVVLDLKYNPTVSGQDTYKKLYSLYIQFLQFQSFDRLYLLQKLDISNLQFCPYYQLLTEIERLKVLEQKTISV